LSTVINISDGDASADQVMESDSGSNSTSTEPRRVLLSAVGLPACVRRCGARPQALRQVSYGSAPKARTAIVESICDRLEIRDRLLVRNEAIAGHRRFRPHRSDISRPRKIRRRSQLPASDSCYLCTVPERAFSCGCGQLGEVLGAEKVYIGAVEPTVPAIPTAGRSIIGVQRVVKVGTKDGPSGW